MDYEIRTLRYTWKKKKYLTIKIAHEGVCGAKLMMIKIFQEHSRAFQIKCDTT